MDPKIIRRAASLCVASYKDAKMLQSCQALESHRVVNLYRVSNEVRAFIFKEPVKGGVGKTYVVFRGTIPSMAGNWLFANFQLYKTRYQNSPLAGTVHMGFYRAFHWLWHDSEPKPDEKHQADRLKVFFKRHLFLARLFVAAGASAFFAMRLLFCAEFDGDSVTMMLGILIALWSGLILFEIGFLEALFRILLPKPPGTPLEALIEDINKCDAVIFTGHSLGGAIATIAFAEYQRQSSIKNGRLITFGAPRLGDEDCIKAFENNILHQERYLHVVNLGDPVPNSPGTLEQAMSLPEEAGWLRDVMIFAGRSRKIWAVHYQQSAPGDWSGKNDSLMKLGDWPLSADEHSMSLYLRNLGRKSPPAPPPPTSSPPSLPNSPPPPDS